MIAFRIRVMQAHAKRHSVGVPQLETEPPHKVPLSFRSQLMRHGHIHCPAHAGIPAFLCLLCACGKFGGLHVWADDLAMDDILFVLRPIVLLAGALIDQFAAGVVGDLGKGTVTFGATDRANGQVENRHVRNRGFGLVGKKNRCLARGSGPPPPTAGRTRVVGELPRCVSALRLSSKGSGSSEVVFAWVTGYLRETATVGASFAIRGKAEVKISASCGEAFEMSSGRRD